MSDPLQNWHPRGIDTTTPSTARMYDYYLGGKDNYPVDREAAEQVIAQHPQQRQLARNNRAFLVRAVRSLAEDGITQFIDIGTGIPTSPSVHEVAREVHPGAHVVYVDNDPVVLAHNRALLNPDDRVTTIEGDMRDPEGILADRELRNLIDFGQPVGLLFVSVLHFVPADEPKCVLSRFADVMAPGSYLVASVGSSEGLTEEEMARIAEGYGEAAVSTVARSREQIEDLFDGFDLAEPGLVDVSQWRAAEPQTHVKILAGVGRKT